MESSNNYHLKNVGSSYTPCFQPGMKRCNSKQLNWADNVKEEECKQMCNANKKCNFIFYNTGSFCAIFESCDRLEDALGFGIISAKDNCPGTILSFL